MYCIINREGEEKMMDSSFWWGLLAGIWLYALVGIGINICSNVYNIRKTRKAREELEQETDES